MLAAFPFLFLWGRVLKIFDITDAASSFKLLKPGRYIYHIAEAVVVDPEDFKLFEYWQVVLEAPRPLPLPKD